jgi:hypothetical protein
MAKETPTGYSNLQTRLEEIEKEMSGDIRHDIALKRLKEKKEIMEALDPKVDITKEYQAVLADFRETFINTGKQQLEDDGNPSTSNKTKVAAKKK